jgi:hypothetical protein
MEITINNLILKKTSKYKLQKMRKLKSITKILTRDDLHYMVEMIEVRIAINQ